MAGTINAPTTVDPDIDTPAPRRRGRRLLTLIAALAAVLALSGVLTSCETTAGDRQLSIDLINLSRGQNGVRPVVANGQLNTKADLWASQMRDRCQISHSRLADGAPSGWQKLGENVGRGGNISQVHVAYLNSPGHRRNILDPAFNQVGTAAVYGNCNGHRMVFTVQVFMRG
jgi:uncharacterized protein YkwD